jgi:hypothetical protein
MYTPGVLERKQPAKMSPLRVFANRPLSPSARKGRAVRYSADDVEDEEDNAGPYQYPYQDQYDPSLSTVDQLMKGTNPAFRGKRPSMMVRMPASIASPSEPEPVSLAQPKSKSKSKSSPKSKAKAKAKSKSNSPKKAKWVFQGTGLHRALYNSETGELYG